jgi:hypothetical protein
MLFVPTVAEVGAGMAAGLSHGRSRWNEVLSMAKYTKGGGGEISQ